MTQPPVLIVTPGDPDGIGPEVVWKALRKGIERKLGVRILCVGARAPFDALGATVVEANSLALIPPRPPKSGRRPVVWLVPAPKRAPPAKRALLVEGFQTGWSIQRATTLVLQGKGSALVTGPINKARLQAGGFPFPGHTEFLAHVCRSGPVTMMLANDQLRVSLVTTHLSLREVPAALNRDEIRRAVLQTVDFLRQHCRISRPEIAVCALNPHAGESGLFGNEEIRVIQPAVRSLQRLARGRFQVHGPLPADTLFANNARKALYDAVICMYHDQGLVPVKLLDFQRTVNVTLGLPILRTSVDHGVAFDIAGKGIADESSFCSAVEMAASIAKKSVKGARSALA